MRRRIFSVLLILCMTLTLLPATASAVPVYELWVGNTNVSIADENPTYWKLTEDPGNPDDYDNIGDATDYAFSVSFASDTATFTLTLNGVDIEDAFESYYWYYYGIFAQAVDLIIVLNEGTVNSIDARTSNISGNYGIYSDEDITFAAEGGGSLDITVDAGPGSGTGIYTTFILRAAASPPQATSAALKRRMAPWTSAARLRFWISRPEPAGARILTTASMP